MSCTFSAVTEWALHMNKTLAVGNGRKVRVTQSTPLSTAQPRGASRERAMCSNLRARALVWKPAVAARGGLQQQQMAFRSANSAVRRLRRAGRGCGGRRRGAVAGGALPRRGTRPDSPVPRPAIVVTVSRVRETFRDVPFIPGSCLDSEINSKIECVCAEARRLRLPGEALSVFRKGFPHGRIYQSQQKGPNSSWLHFTYTQWSYRIQR